MTPASVICFVRKPHIISESSRRSRDRIVVASSLGFGSGAVFESLMTWSLGGRLSSLGSARSTATSAFWSEMSAIIVPISSAWLDVSGELTSIVTVFAVGGPDRVNAVVNTSSAWLSEVEVEVN